MEFRILGPLEVWAAGVRLRLRGPRSERLLAALLLDAGDMVPLGRLVEAAWDGDPPATVGRQAQNLVAALRRMLIGAGAPGDIVTTERAGYALRLDPDLLDAARFDRDVETARRCRANDVETAVTAYRSGLALWRGPALAGIGSPFLEAGAARWDELRAAAWEECLAGELSLGRQASVIAELTTLADQYPYREHVARLLMLALYRHGRQADALAAYRRLRARLAGELGLDPSEETRQLHDAILRRDPDVDVVDPPGARAAAPTVVTVAPAWPTPAQLPADVAAFTGRRAQLKYLDTLLPDEYGRRATTLVIATIVGTAGVGKTALAVHWAHQVRERFGDGQLYVNLRGYAPEPPVRPIEALAGFLHALGVPTERVPTDEHDAAALYRSLLAGKRVLVVLDNAIHPDQVRPLLPGGGGCLALVTSRDALVGLAARDGARPLEVDVLSPDEARTLLAMTLGADRVAAESHAATELAAWCAHLPLAVRVAAAQLTTDPQHTIADYCDRLRAESPLTVLDIPDDRQAAVRAALDVSYRTQPAPVQRVFRLLGLMPGPDFTVDIAAALAGTAPSDTARLLDRLAAAHLIESRAPGRYGFHDLLRSFAAELAGIHDGPDVQAATRRLYDWYLHTVDAAARLLYPHMLRLPISLTAAPHPPASFADGPDALAWLDAERANLVAAVSHAARHGPRRAAWALADGVRGYFYLRLHSVDWATIADAAAAAAEVDADLRARTSAQFSFALLPWQDGRHTKAIEHYGAALALARQASWRAGEAAAQGCLGNVYRLVGQLERAAACFLEVLRLNSAPDGPPGLTATTLGNLGLVYWELGQLDRAVDQLSMAVPRFRAIGSRSGEATVLANLGEVRLALGRPDEAMADLTTALALHAEVGHRASVGDTQRCIAEVHCGAGRYRAALDSAQAALTVALDTGHARYEAHARNALGTIHRHLGDHQQARDQHERALAVARAAGQRSPEVRALIGLALALRNLGHDSADARAGEAVALARQSGYRLLERQALAVVAELVG